MAESHREEIAKLEALYAGNPGGRVFVHLAEAYRKAGEHERARRILDEGLARHPDSASGYVVLGRVLADMQITGEAEIAFRRVLDLDGGNLVALRWLGDLARQSGRNADAAMHYRELLIRNPSNEEVRDLVEIVEREAEGTGAPVAARADDATREAGTDELRVDAFPGLDDRREPEGQQEEAEQAALTPPPSVSDAAPPDITPWSAAPGRTGDAEEPPVEYGLVELDTGESAAEAAGTPDGPLESGRDAADGEATDVTGRADTAPDEEAPAAAEPVGQPDAGAHERPAAYDDRPASAWAYPTGPADESDVVASVDEDDAEGLELDELRRDDEAEPLEIHLLDPSYEASEEEETEEFLGELDLSDMANAGSLEDADDYADEAFVADLMSAGQEPSAPDELPGDADVLDAGLTLLPDDTGGDTAEAPHASHGADEQEPAPFGHEAAAPAGDSPEAAPQAHRAEPTEEPVPFAHDAGSTADSGEPAPWPGAGMAETEPELSEAGFTALSGAAEPAAESTPAAEVRRTEPGLVTETMAVLYRSQGFHDRAADVYRALLRTRPDDARLAARLREAEEAAAAASGPRTEDEAGEVWLRGVGAAWTAEAESSATAETTPYAWTGEAEDGETGEPIGTYLHDLVSWRAGSGNWPARDAEPHETQAPGEIEVPEWLNGPGSSEPWAPESEPADYPVVPAAESDWSQAPAQTEPWATSADAATPDEFTSDAVSSDGEDTVSEGSLDAWSLPADEPPETAADAEPEEESGGWTPLELDRDVPAAGQPAAAAETQAGPADEDDSSEDDDLEMFRSWLQSLKK